MHIPSIRSPQSNHSGFSAAAAVIAESPPLLLYPSGPDQPLPESLSAVTSVKGLAVVAILVVRVGVAAVAAIRSLLMLGVSSPNRSPPLPSRSFISALLLAVGYEAADRAKKRRRPAPHHLGQRQFRFLNMLGWV